MNIADFKTEFSVLLNRYTIFNSPTDESSNDVSSSSSSSPNHRDLLDAIQESLHAVLNVKLQYLEESVLKTPANNEIVVATPDAPDVLRMDYNQTNRYDSELKLPNFNGLHTHREERVEVLDNDNKVDNANNNNNKDVKNANLSMMMSVMKDQQHGDHHEKFHLGLIVDETKHDLQKALSKLQRISDILKPETRHEPHAVRRLSTILNPSAKKSTANQSHHTSLLRSTIQRAKAARRSLAAVSDDVVTTPTTSRPSHAPVPQSTTTMKKSTSTHVPASTATSKLAQHSVSISSLMLDKPKSPVKKNPKYAHVQSTIPKAIVVHKKKAT